MSTETAVVVGVGPGLGTALVNGFAREGYTVFAAARKPAADTPAPGGGKVVHVTCDATDPAQVEELFARAARGGTLRVAVFNAGTFQRGTVVETDPAEFERCWKVGCFGGFLVGRAAAKRMLEHGAGTILFTGATASLRGGAGFVNLASPKFALRAVAQSLARELGPKGIHVAHVIIDGQIHSDRYAHLAGERGPDSLLEPGAIAEAYLALHRQPRNAWTQELDLRPWVERF
ncbi:MAG TPA: SDR family NAD(P)-dependent oxidoreductase [Steroidobacteraceae bacterium]|jgi:NAD(P)-dependent dehydrogenase (short-subunit alcohol dehydrogenase family)|nr:SDR family NAD(P)-dependent oxidoreductase [Steroidobacteraceae bacterium]